jgi:hypothetical protein
VGEEVVAAAVVAAAAAARTAADEDAEAPRFVADEVTEESPARVVGADFGVCTGSVVC